MQDVAVIDYGMGNVDSVRRALESLGVHVAVTSDHRRIEAADRLVLPGVGAFGVAMANLADRGLIDLLQQVVIADGAPILGICLGMQLMATRGTEHGEHRGLGWIPASVMRLTPADLTERVPHVGWNEVNPTADHPLFGGVEVASDCYFVHSYHVVCDRSEHVVATTPYAGSFASAVASGHIMGVQFHPEKSQRVGLSILRNFLSW